MKLYAKYRKNSACTADQELTAVVAYSRGQVTYRDGLTAQMVTHPSINPAVHGQEWNSRHVDHKFDPLTTILPRILRGLDFAKNDGVPVWAFIFRSD